MNLALRCGRGHSWAKATRGPSSQRQWNFALPTACQRATRRSTVLLCVPHGCVRGCRGGVCVGRGRAQGALGRGAGVQGHGQAGAGGVCAPGSAGHTQGLGFVLVLGCVWPGTGLSVGWPGLLAPEVHHGGMPYPPALDRPVMRETDPMRFAYGHFLRVSKLAESEEETFAHQQVWATRVRSCGGRLTPFSTSRKSPERSIYSPRRAAWRTSSTSWTRLPTRHH